MATASASVRVVLANPGLENSGGVLTVMLPIINAGEVRLSELACTNVTLGAASRISPPGFPLVIGSISPGGTASLIAKFSSVDLLPGARRLLTLRASYLIGQTRYGLTLNQYITMPQTVTPALRQLRARVEVTVEGTFWNYTVLNDEEVGSEQRLAAFSLKVAAPTTVTGTPAGWRAETDSTSFVLWTAADPLPPYPSHIAAGALLQGFQLMSPRTRSEASPFTLAAWNHTTDDAGFVVGDYILVPNRSA